MKQAVGNGELESCFANNNGIKRPIGQPKLQPHMTLQTFGRCIKQETKNPRSIKELPTHDGLHCTFGLAFRLQWIGIKVGQLLTLFPCISSKTKGTFKPI